MNETRANGQSIDAAARRGKNLNRPSRQNLPRRRLNFIWLNLAP